MNAKVVRIDTRRIRDWSGFHDVFADAMGFPDFYGRNMDAWIDCLTSLDQPNHGMTLIHAPAGGVFVLQLDYLEDFAVRCPEQYAAVIECAGFVNWRRIEMGDKPVVALSFNKTPPG
jgi:hypothetical protein